MQDACLTRTVRQPVRNVCLKMEPSGAKACTAPALVLGEGGGRRGQKPQALGSGGWRELGGGEEVGGRRLRPAAPPPWLARSSPGRPGTEGSVAEPHLSSWARRPDWSPAELVSRGAGPLLAAPANMLHCWVTENKPVTWAEWAEVLPGSSSLPASFCLVSRQGQSQALPQDPHPAEV